MNRVQFQCPRLRQWPGHSNKWGSQQLSGLPHPQSNLCSGSVLPQHLLFTRHISPSHCPSRDCSHLTGLSTSLLPHHSPFSLQTAIKSDCLFISHPALYAGNSWTHCSRDKTQTSHFGPQDPALQSGAVQSQPNSAQCVHTPASRSSVTSFLFLQLTRCPARLPSAHPLHLRDTCPHGLQSLLYST